MAKISVIIPIYNVEKYISECVESVLNQTFRDIEIICVDDCGSDNSIKIVQEYANKDNRIVILKHSKNKGLGATRNTGLKYATSDYVFFLDSDDIVSENILEIMYNKIKETNADVVSSNTEPFTEDSDEYVQKRVKFLKKWLSVDKYKDCKLNTENFLYHIESFPCVCWGKLYSRDFLERNKLTFINKKVIHEDNGFWLKLASCFPNLAFVYDVGIFYRIRANAITYDIEKYGYKYEYIKYKKRNMNTVLQDVFSYINKTKNKDIAKILKDKIIKSKEYNKYIYKHIGFFYRRSSIINSRYLYILGIPLYREKIKNNILEKRVLGMKMISKITNKMHIFFASDDNFAQHLCVSIASILKSAKKEDKLNFYILSDNISEFYKNKILNLQKIKNFNIEFIDVNNDLFANCPQIEQCKQITKQTYYRYIIPQIKPELEKVLYLDCDIVVKKSLSDLWNTDLEDKYCAAVQEFSPEWSYKDAKRLGVDAEFNAGVLLINNKKWKDENLTKVFFDNTVMLYNEKLLLWQDQDVLNYTFRNNVKWLNPEFNYQQNAQNKPYYTKYTKQDILNAKKRIVIIHYNNPHKPWLLNSKFYPNEYYQALYIAGFKKKAISLFINNISNKYFCIQKNNTHKIIKIFGIKLSFKRKLR